MVNGDALRLVYGYDTFGNTCNRGNNEMIEIEDDSEINLSGQDTTDKT